MARPLEAAHRRESAVVGLIVADENRQAAAKRLFFHECGHRAVLGVRRRLDLDDRVAIEQRELRHQRRGQQRHLGAQLVLELAAPCRKCSASPAPLSSSSRPGWRAASRCRPARTSASCSSATGATCISPRASRRSQPCMPASGQRRVAEQPVEIGDGPAADQRQRAAGRGRAQPLEQRHEVPDPRPPRPGDPRARAACHPRRETDTRQSSGSGTACTAAASRAASCIIRAV